MGKHEKIYLATGSNQGDRWNYLGQAAELLEDLVGPIRKRSKIYETEAWGCADQAPFLNQVLELETQLSPQELIATCLQIEKMLGRRRRKKWEARPIDIDILFYGEEVIEEEELQIPHAQMHLRNFVLVPMMEIAGDFVHPVLHQDIETLYLQSNDPLEVIQKD